MDSDRALDILLETTNTHSKYFKIYNPNSSQFEYQPATANETYGIILKGGDVAYYPQQLRKILFDKGFTSPTAVIAEFSQRGWLVESENLPNGRKHQTYVTVEGNSPCMYRFKAKIFSVEKLAA